jgi:hypothetical protein
MWTGPLRGAPTDSERAFLDETRRHLAACHDQVRHSLHQLDGAHGGRRTADGSGGVARSVLHLCGDLDHKILSVVGGLSARSDRPGAPADGDPASREALLARLDAAVDRADAVLAVITPDRLREARRYAGLGQVVEGTVLSVILGALLDLARHTQELAALARSRPGDRFRLEAPAFSPSPAAT